MPISATHGSAPSSCEQNPAALRAIAERFAAARRRGLWHARRNAVDDELATLIAEAREREAA